ISVPLATSASRINSLEANFPVPTSNRHVNSRSAIFSLEGLSDIRFYISRTFSEREGRQSVPSAMTGEDAYLPTARRFSLYESCCVRQIAHMTQFDLHQQDCVEGMATLPSEHVDLVVTSPPYNLGVRYQKYSDRQDRQTYLEWCEKWAAEVRRVLRPTGSFFLNVGS